MEGGPHIVTTNHGTRQGHRWTPYSKEGQRRGSAPVRHRMSRPVPWGIGQNGRAIARNLWLIACRPTDPMR